MEDPCDDIDIKDEPLPPLSDEEDQVSEVVNNEGNLTERRRSSRLKLANQNLNALPTVKLSSEQHAKVTKEPTVSDKQVNEPRKVDKESTSSNSEIPDTINVEDLPEDYFADLIGLEVVDSWAGNESEEDHSASSPEYEEDEAEEKEKEERFRDEQSKRKEDTRSDRSRSPISCDLKNDKLKVSKNLAALNKNDDLREMLTAIKSKTITNEDEDPSSSAKINTSGDGNLNRSERLKKDLAKSKGNNEVCSSEHQSKVDNKGRKSDMPSRSKSPGKSARSKSPHTSSRSLNKNRTKSPSISKSRSSDRRRKSKSPRQADRHRQATPERQKRSKSPRRSTQDSKKSLLENPIEFSPQPEFVKKLPLKGVPPKQVKPKIKSLLDIDVFTPTPEIIYPPGCEPEKHVRRGSRSPSTPCPITPERRSSSPHRRHSQSTRHRSRSTERTSGHRSRSRSPGHHQRGSSSEERFLARLRSRRSRQKQSCSPVLSLSPRRRSPKRTRSRSPRRDTRSPRKHSRSPRRRSISPRRRSRSPRRRNRSPRRRSYSRSPARKKSPLFDSRHGKSWLDPKKIVEYKSNTATSSASTSYPGFPALTPIQTNAVQQATQVAAPNFYSTNPLANMTTVPYPQYYGAPYSYATPYQPVDQSTYNFGIPPQMPPVVTYPSVIPISSAVVPPPVLTTPVVQPVLTTPVVKPVPPPQPVPPPSAAIKEAFTTAPKLNQVNKQPAKKENRIKIVLDREKDAVPGRPGLRAVDVSKLKNPVATTTMSSTTMSSATTSSCTARSSASQPYELPTSLSDTESSSSSSSSSEDEAHLPRLSALLEARIEARETGYKPQFKFQVAQNISQVIDIWEAQGEITKYPSFTAGVSPVDTDNTSTQNQASKHVSRFRQRKPLIKCTINRTTHKNYNLIEKSTFVPPPKPPPKSILKQPTAIVNRTSSIGCNTDPIPEPESPKCLECEARHAKEFMNRWTQTKDQVEKKHEGVQVGRDMEMNHNPAQFRFQNRGRLQPREVTLTFPDREVVVEEPQETLQFQSFPITRNLERPPSPARMQVELYPPRGNNPYEEPVPPRGQGNFVRRPEADNFGRHPEPDNFGRRSAPDNFGRHPECFNIAQDPFGRGPEHGHHAPPFHGGNNQDMDYRSEQRMPPQHEVNFPPQQHFGNHGNYMDLDAPPVDPHRRDIRSRLEPPTQDDERLVRYRGRNPFTNY